MATRESLGASFRDPSGFVFRRGGVLYRQVNHTYADQFSALESNGLIDELTEAKLLISHEHVDESPPAPDIAWAVIRPQQEPFVSYPYEWCLGQLQDAALATLEIQTRALEHGMALTYAGAFNVHFLDGRPILIDSLSFEEYVDGRPWVAYRQFCERFLAALLLISRIDPWLGRLPRLTVDGVPLEAASRLLPTRSWATPTALLHIHLHARSIRKYGGQAVPTQVAARGLSKKGILNLVEGLRHALERLDWTPAGTEWSDYEAEHGYSDAQLADKWALVKRMLRDIGPATVWDLGANTAAFSRLAMKCGATVVSIDSDPAAVERNYRMKQRAETTNHPLWIDLTNPSPGLGWSGEERESLLERSPADVVLALALVHHLAIGASVPLRMIANWLSGLARNLGIEFIPKEDPQTKRLLVSREDVFPTYARDGFESAFDEYFDLRERRSVGDGGRLLYSYRTRTC